MKMVKWVFFTASLVVMAGTSASAGADNRGGRNAYHADSTHHDKGRRWHGLDDLRDPWHVDHIQRRQREAIAHGIRRGLLTEHEAHRLIREQREIERLERRFESDGVMTEHELARLERELDGARWNIRRQMSDDDRSYRGHGHVYGWYGWR